MKTKMVDRTEEKIKLAREIGLTRWADVKADDAARETAEKAYIAQMSSMNFKPVTQAEIETMLVKRVFKAFYHEGGFFMGLFGWAAASTVATLIFYGMSCGMNDPKQWLLATAGWASLVGFISFLGCSFPKTRVAVKMLSEWKDNLPYGALLAVKEAKDKGLTHFKIYFPKLEERVKADPVITGVGVGRETEFMIFAWDDSKIYE